MLLDAVFLYRLEEEISHSMELGCRKGEGCQSVLVIADKMSDEIQKLLCRVEVPSRDILISQFLANGIEEIVEIRETIARQHSQVTCCCMHNAIY